MLDVICLAVSRLPGQGGRQLVQAKRELSLERRTSAELTKAPPEGGLAEIHQVGRFGPRHRVWVADRFSRSLGRLHSFEGLRVSEPLCDCSLPEGPEPGEGVLLVVVPHLHHTLFVSFLFLLQTNSKSTTHGVTQSLPGLLAGQKAVAQPPPACPVTANVRKSGLVIPVRSTEGNFLYRLIQDQTLGL